MYQEDCMHMFFTMLWENFMSLEDCKNTERKRLGA